MTEEFKTQITCGFCFKPHQQVRAMVAGFSAAICDECVETCSEIVAEADDPTTQEAYQCAAEVIEQWLETVDQVQ